MSDIDVLACTCWGEARGEGLIGMKAVACVVMNRVAQANTHPHFGDGSFAGACLAPYQFSCWNTHDPNYQLIHDVDNSDPVFAQAMQIATSAVNGLIDDITNGATYYYVKGSPEPSWAVGKTPCCVIGHHLFFNDIA